MAQIVVNPEKMIALRCWAIETVAQGHAACTSLPSAELFVAEAEEIVKFVLTPDVSGWYAAEVRATLDGE